MKPSCTWMPGPLEARAKGDPTASLADWAHNEGMPVWDQASPGLHSRINYVIIIITSRATKIIGLPIQ